MPTLLLFDVNGTLLDIDALQPELSRIFGDALPVRSWFTQLIQYSMALTCAGEFVELGELAGAVLEMAAEARHIQLSSGDIESVKNRMKSLPPFRDVKPALDRLKAAGIRLAVLTNSGAEAREQQLRFAGIRDYFETTLSVSAVKKYKPAPEVYRFAASSLGLEPSEILMVAAHGWDLLGASRAGLRTAFIARPGEALVRYVKPDLIAADFAQLADILSPGLDKDLDFS